MCERKGGFKLMDIPELSLHDVLVVPVKETQKVYMQILVDFNNSKAVPLALTIIVVYAFE